MGIISSPDPAVLRRIRYRLAALVASSALAATSCAGILGFERLEEGGDTSLQEAGGPLLPDGTAPPSDADAQVGDAVGSRCPPPGDDAGCGYARSIVHDGRCYFVAGGLLRPGDSEKVCESEGGTLATFTCPAEWLAIRSLINSNLWINASYNGSAWVWNTGEAFDYVVTNAGFDGGAPRAADQVCMWITQSSEWTPVICATSSGEPLCERGPLAP